MNDTNITAPDPAPKYTFGFVETVIALTDSFSPDVKQAVHDLAAKNELSGIDAWRDFVIDAAKTFETYTEGIDWNSDIGVVDYVSAVDKFADMTVVRTGDSVDFPTKDTFLADIGAVLNDIPADTHTADNQK